MWSVLFLLGFSMFLDGAYCMFMLVFCFIRFLFLFNYQCFYLMLLKNFSMYLDILGVYFSFLAFLLVLLVLCMGFYVKFSEIHFSLSLFLLMVLCMFFSSSKLFTIFMFFELSFISVVLFVLFWGVNPERMQATSYMVVYTFLGSVPMFLSIVAVYHSWEKTSYFMSCFHTKDGTSYHYYDYFLEKYMTLFWVLAFLMKLPIFGCHLWLPKAHVEAPVYGSMLLAGIMLKVGVFGIIRYMSWSSFVQYKIVQFGLCYMYLGLVVLGLVCVRQFDLKSFVAYSSMVHMSLMVLGIGAGGFFSEVGSAFISFAHGVCSSGLFLVVNMLYLVSGTRKILLNRGFLCMFPLQMFMLFFLCICNCSVPPSLNFFGEVMLIYKSVTHLNGTYLFFALNVFLTGLYCMYLFTSISHGKMVINLKFLGCKKDNTLLSVNSFVHIITGYVYFMYMSDITGIC